MERLGDLFKAVRATVAELDGAYALAVISQQDPDRIIVARMGCPVVIGLGVDENFVASDVAALLPVTRRFMFLEEGDVAEVTRDGVRIFDRDGNQVDARRARERAVAPTPPRRARTGTSCSRRSTSSRARSPTRCRSASPTGDLLEAAFGPAAAAGVRARRSRAHRRLRHQLSRRHRGPLFHRADLPAALPRRDRQRIPLPQSRGAEELAVRDDLAVGRDRRYARGDAAGASSSATWRRWRSATSRRARWCANPSW